MQNFQFKSFFKKPVKVRAFHFNSKFIDSLRTKNESLFLKKRTSNPIIKEYLNGKIIVYLFKNKNLNVDYSVIQTSDGKAIVQIGDWIVMKTCGELYSVKENIFIETHST